MLANVHSKDGQFDQEVETLDLLLARCWLSERSRCFDVRLHPHTTSKYKRVSSFQSSFRVRFDTAFFACFVLRVFTIATFALFIFC